MLTRLWLWWTRRSFRPGVFEHADLRMTEIVLTDTFTVYRPLDIPGVSGHCVDLGYDERGKLVAVKIWDLVGRRN